MKIYASSKGLAPKPGFDNTAAFNRMIEMAKDKTIVDVNGSDNRYFFNDTIFLDKTIYLECDPDTIFDFGGINKPGLVIKGGYKSEIHRITLWNHNYSKVYEPNQLREPGLVINAVSRLNDVTVRGFGGNGFHLSADIAAGSGRDASASRLDSCNAIENGGDGFLTRAGDANAIGFYHCDARDNGGWGFHDDSFLGCSFYSCMAHASKKGHYKATGQIEGANNRSYFGGCYAEGDSPPNRLAGQAMWVGGIAANGFELGDNACVMIGNRITTVENGDIKIAPTGFEFKHTTGSFPMKFEKVGDPRWPHYGYRNSLSGFFSEVFTAEMGFKAEYNGRQVPFSSQGFKSFFIGSRFFAEAKPEDAWLKDFQFKYGDTLLNPDYTGEGTKQWVYKKTGWIAEQ